MFHGRWSFFYARGAPPPLARAAPLEDSLCSRGPQALSGGRQNAVEDHDLLPDFSRQTIRQVLDVVHRGHRHRVIELLNVERRDLADERELIAAVIEVADQLRRVLR